MGLTRRRLAAALLPALAACGGDADTPDGALTVSWAVAPAPIADAPMALYLEVANAGAAADTLLGIRVAGGDATLHETVGGTMRPVGPLPVPAGGTLALRPGGLHAMLEGPARPAEPGDTLRATLRFARAGEVPVAAPVVPYAELEGRLGAADPGAGR